MLESFEKNQINRFQKTSKLSATFFLSKTPFADHQIMFTYMFDDNTVKNRAIVATECEGRFFKVKQAFRLLERFNIALLDGDFQLVSFSTRTFTRCSFRIRPVGAA